MSQWPAAKAKRVLAALLRIGWSVKRESGSHRTLTRQDRPDFVFAFHDSALRFAQVWGTTPGFWMNLQQMWDLYRTMHSADAKKIEKLKRIPASA